MIKSKTYTVNEVYNSSFLAFIFEFYCSKETSFIINDLQKILGKTISLTYNENTKPNFSSGILLKEYDGNRPRYQFKVDYQNYRDIPTFLNTTLFWINENTSLNNSTLLKVNLNYDFNKLKTLSTISNMDIGKLILKIDENYIFDRFKEMKHNTSSMSIKKLMPYNMSVNASNVVNLKNQFRFTIDKFYGIDLTEQTKGEITFNYIGGPKYSEKVKEIYELLEYFIIITYQSLNENEYQSSELYELNKLTEEYRTFRKCYYNPNKFFDIYKDFKISIDLNYNKSILETQWFQIRDIVSKLILESNIKKCKFNWDTEEGTFQIKDAEIKNCILRDLHIVDSNIQGVIECCKLWKSEIKNSIIKNSTLVIDNKIENCYIQNTRADRDNKINESFITNKGEIINCTINNCILKNVGLGNLAKLDENSIIILPKEKMINPAQNGLIITEIRDYQWIKSLRDINYKDKGFQNEYKEE